MTRRGENLMFRQILNQVTIHVPQVTACSYCYPYQVAINS